MNCARGVAAIWKEKNENDMLEGGAQSCQLIDVDSEGGEGGVVVSVD